MIKFMGFVATVQMALGVVLAIAVSWAYMEYRSSVGGLLTQIAATTDKTAKAVSSVAELMKVRQQTLNDIENSVESNSKMLELVEAAAAKQLPLYSQHATTLLSASEICTLLGGIFSSLGDWLVAFSLPTFEVKGGLPKVAWTNPYEAKGQAIRGHGEGFANLSVGLKSVANSFNDEVPKLTTGVIDTARNARIVLDGLKVDLRKLKAEGLPKALDALEEASRSLDEASKNVGRVERFAVALLAIGLLLSVLFFMSGVGFLFVARAFAQRRHSQTS